MITIKNIKLLDGTVQDVEFEGEDKTIDAEGKLSMLPALIDPHVHFRTPGEEHKEDWIHGARAAIAGGVTTVLDMPNNIPACSTQKALHKKKERIEKQLQEADIPLRAFFYFGADETHLDQISLCKKEIIGIKVYMGSSTGSLVMNKLASLEKVFQIAAQENLILTVHAEDEEILQARAKQFSGEANPAVHSKIRDREAAIKAVDLAISLAEQYSTQLMIAHVTTKQELSLIREAKKKEMIIYAEATPHHLFLTEDAYKKWGTKVQMNPPLRTVEDQEELWEAVRDGTIDTIGSDHAPHTLEEKNQPYGKAPSGVAGLETTLPLLLTASKRGLFSIEKLVELTRINPERIFRLPPTKDSVLVDLETERAVEDRLLQTKCGWSPFAGRKLIGWPVYTLLNGRIYDLRH